jgi:hypothetical protein
MREAPTSRSSVLLTALTLALSWSRPRAAVTSLARMSVSWQPATYSMMCQVGLPAVPPGLSAGCIADRIGPGPDGGNRAEPGRVSTAHAGRRWRHSPAPGEGRLPAVLRTLGAGHFPYPLPTTAASSTLFPCAASAHLGCRSPQLPGPCGGHRRRTVHSRRGSWPVDRPHSLRGRSMRWTHSIGVFWEGPCTDSTTPSLPTRADRLKQGPTHGV